MSNGISSSEFSSNGQCDNSPKTNDTPNGKPYSNDFHATSGNIFPKILVWSAGDEGGIDRLMDIWHDYLLKPLSANVPEEIYMDKLAYTLERRRSSLPWKAFAIVDSVKKLAVIKGLISRPVRSSEGHSIGLVFTGQGAVYNRMGVALSEYPVFRDTLESFDRELMLLGCKWSVFGKTETHQNCGKQTSMD